MLPNQRGRPGVEELLQNGTLKRFADLTKGFSAADLKNFATEVILPFPFLSFIISCVFPLLIGDLFFHRLL